jgi:uncharacterized protein YeaO (DUF488 family)
MAERGKKEEARIDEWMKELAPGSEFRKWFDHDPDKGEEIKTAPAKEARPCPT